MWQIKSAIEQHVTQNKRYYENIGTTLGSVSQVGPSGTFSTQVPNCLVIPYFRVLETVGADNKVIRAELYVQYTLYDSTNGSFSSSTDWLKVPRTTFL